MEAGMQSGHLTPLTLDGLMLMIVYGSGCFTGSKYDHGSALCCEKEAMQRGDSRCLGWLDANVLVQLRVRQRQLHSFLDLLHLLLQPSHVRIGLQGRLLHLHMSIKL